jgi:hypothetical protein
MVLVGSTFAAGGLMAIAVACGDADGSTFDGSSGGEDAGGSFETGTFNTEGGAVPGQDAGPVDCNPHLQATFTPSFKAPTRASACSAEDLAKYFDVCVELNESECTKWRSEHAACTACIEPEDLSGPIQQQLSRTYQTFNVAGCISVRKGETAEGTCPVAYWNAIQCFRDACSECPKKPGATFQDVLKCQAESRTTACNGWLLKAINGDAGACKPDYNDPGGGAYECFQQSTDKKADGGACDQANTGRPCRAHYIRAMGVFCGPT